MSSERSSTPRPRGEADDLALFHRTLAELCRSEVPLPKAFRVLEADLDRSPLRAAIREMAADVERGVPLAEAYGKRSELFPPTYRALVEAGTASGDLPGVLEEVAAHAERRAETESRVRRALAWPLLSGLLILLVGAGALAFAVPRFWGLNEAVGGRSPAPYAFGALGVLAAFVVAIAWITWRRAPAHGGWGLSLPTVGPLRLDAGRATVTSTLGMLLGRRLPLPQALELAAGTAAHPRLVKRLEAAAAQAHEGESLVDVLEGTELFEPSVLWLVRSAEPAGEADRALDDMARIYRRRLDRRLDRFTLLVRPAAELVIGAVVFCFAFSYLVPLFEYTQLILRVP
ncbi:MAG: type II secretion system F family protein [Planctomycetota bacterium]